MEIDDMGGAEFAKMAGRLSFALPSLAETSSISNHLKRGRISPTQLFPLWQKSPIFADAPLPRNAKKWKISKNRQKSTRSLASEECENRKIARNLVGLGSAKILKILNAEGPPRFSHSPKPDCLVR